jgi:hypothetical protein
MAVLSRHESGDGHYRRRRDGSHLASGFCIDSDFGSERSGDADGGGDGGE